MEKDGCFSCAMFVDWQATLENAEVVSRPLQFFKAMGPDESRVLNLSDCP